MNIAFYAPMKAPDHPVPSGDRAMGRMLMLALRRAGHEVNLVSRLRTFERAGDPAAQARIRGRARGVRSRLEARWQEPCRRQRPDIWFTYHVYHKAPDLLGPGLSEWLGVPYVVAEASHAPKQAGGPWDCGYRASEQAILQARRLVCVNPADTPCLRALLGGADRLRPLAPFIDVDARSRHAARRRDAVLARRRALGVAGDVPLLVTVAMMRPGAKLASYTLLADALARLCTRRWQLLVIGDGPARERVQRVLAPLGERVCYAGAVDGDDLPAWLAGCDLHLWPAVDEAYGMVFLEAAAAGVPSVAGDEGGVASVVADGRSGVLVPARDPAAFALAVDALLTDETRRGALAAAAGGYVRERHALGTAAATLDRVLAEALREDVA